MIETDEMRPRERSDESDAGRDEGAVAAGQGGGR
jgi:hypothetical protein